MTRLTLAEAEDILAGTLVRGAELGISDGNPRHLRRELGFGQFGFAHTAGGVTIAAHGLGDGFLARWSNGLYFHRRFRLLRLLLLLWLTLMLMLMLLLFLLQDIMRLATCTRKSPSVCCALRALLSISGPTIRNECRCLDHRLHHGREVVAKQIVVGPYTHRLFCRDYIFKETVLHRARLGEAVDVGRRCGREAWCGRGEGR